MKKLKFFFEIDFQGENDLTLNLDEVENFLLKITNLNVFAVLMY